MNNLEKMGAIARQPHPVHGRIQTVALSDAGARCWRSARSAPPRWTSTARGLSPEEEQIVRRWLVSLAAPDSDLTASRQEKGPRAA
jgi:DNA-binding MarR family transcriptional regulator